MAIGNTGNLTIKDADIERLKRRVGRAYPADPSFTTVTDDVIRRFAQYCVATENPLYSDNAYGKASRFKSIIAAPCTGYVALSGGQKGTGLPGIFALHATDEWLFDKPIVPGDVIHSTRCLTSVTEKASKWGGRAVHQTFEHLIRNQNQELNTTYRTLVIRAERGKATANKKYQEIEPYRYTTEEIQSIYRDYESESIRGSGPRYWEDVVAGESAGHVVKGPLTVSDIICFWMGAGAPLLFPFKLRYLQFRERPGLAIIDPVTNIGHSPESAHFDTELAKRSGLGAPYDTGRQRSCWFAHLATNWMGDAGWLKELRGSFLSPNYVGDTTWIRGTVAEKFKKDGECLVKIAIKAETQRAHCHATGEAIIRLPSRQQGGVQA